MHKNEKQEKNWDKRLLLIPYSKYYYMNHNQKETNKTRNICIYCTFYEEDEDIIPIIIVFIFI